MIVDTSAVVAIIFDEVDGAQFAEIMASGVCLRMSAVNLVETSAVVERRTGTQGALRLEDFFRRCGLMFEPLTLEQAYVARSAYRRFGRGSGSPARLNLGDCFAYALARTMGEPLLYKGRDFACTDIEPAL